MDRLTPSDEQVGIDARADASGGTKFGPARPPFGFSREQGKRIEVTFALRSGGVLAVIDEIAEPVTAELLAGYSDKLAEEVAGGGTRVFVDGWTTTGQRSWVNLADVVAFSVRPAR